ncbi:MAG TPA: hexose kinase [Plantibacter sp.]|uniref:1-phosphofructokinase family hexose kinase n=1 Tax=unclassified Plantibacter TaxID=2624265 RepID=UPI002D0B0748|nr:hexose kinase [Plantibacter sp.]
MIITLTANPSLDHTVELPGVVRRGEVLRAIASREQPGGKGVNVSRALAAADVRTVAVLPGDESDPMIVSLRAQGIDVLAVATGQQVRRNITLTEPDGTTTKINEPGPLLTDDDASRLVEATARAAAAAEWLVIAGSLPPGLAPDFYARVVRAARAVAGGGRPLVAVDSSGEPLAALLAAFAASGERIDLIKPNGAELAELTGVATGDDIEADPALAASVAAQLVGTVDVPGPVLGVLVTLGARGAVIVEGPDAWFAQAPKIVARSTVGAGDSSLAGYLIARTAGLAPAARLAQAVAHGAAAAALPGSDVPPLAETDADTIDVVSLPIVHLDKRILSAH